MRTAPYAMLLLLAADAASQQTHVVPVSLTNVAGPGSTAWPFGLGSACRVQNFFGASETGFVSPVLVRSLEVRGNENVTNVGKSSIDLQIELSTSPVNLANMSATFASNRGTNHTVVFTRKMTQISGSMPTTPGTWSNVWMFDTPFIYNPAQGNLLVEYDIASQPAGTWSHDTTGTIDAGTHGVLGTACHGLGATSTGGGLGGPVTFSMTGGQANAAAFLLLGARGLATPIPIPGNAPCMVFNDILVLIVTTLNGSGAGTVPLNVPEDAGLRTAVVYGQFAAVTSSANVDTTQSMVVTLDGYLSGRIYDTTSNTTLMGSIQRRSAVVIRLGI